MNVVLTFIENGNLHILPEYKLNMLIDKNHY